MYDMKLHAWPATVNILKNMTITCVNKITNSTHKISTHILAHPHSIHIKTTQKSL